MAKNKKEPDDLAYYYGGLKRYMDDIINYAKELSYLIKDSQYYKKYLAAKKTIECDKALASKINDFKKIHLNMEFNKAQGIFPNEDEELMLSNLYSEIMVHHDAREFLEQERQVADLFKNVLDVVLSEAQVDLDFLKK